MCAIQKLLSKRDGLLIQIACIVDDLSEYINHPVETLSVDQLHYQYDFVITEIKKIDSLLYSLYERQRLYFSSQNFQLKNLTDKATSEIVFTVKDSPKNHFSMFETPNPLQ